MVTVDRGGAEGADATARPLSRPEPPTPSTPTPTRSPSAPSAELTDLTTVRRPVRELGELAGRGLLGVRRGEETEHDIAAPT
ncbi:hypothetical protein ACGFNV_28705 [Streptomyces sp. NPDC048751]|uniref:hypothetical protein n=1 Tax=Streptomyces sp. NPDC048751 TaxID=3365591 RepID=UPI0037135890